MPSVITDFSKRMKKMMADIGLATDLTDQYSFNQAKGNIYKRQVTLDNTGKTAKTNYLLAFKLDTKTIYRNNNCGATFNDLRVYDTDQTTELNFWVEAPNTAYTTIFVQVPSIASNSTKNIWLYYGNPALKNKASLTNTCGSVFGLSSLNAWFRANDVYRLFGGGINDLDTVYVWENKVDTQNFAIQNDSTKRPVFKENILNGLPVVRFDGSNDFLQSNYGIIAASLSYSYFVVEGRRASGVMLVLGDNGSATTDRSYDMGYVGGSGNNFRLGQYNNDVSYALGGYSSQVFRQWTAQLNTSTGKFLRLNGTQVGTTANTGPMLQNNLLRIGTGQALSAYYNGDIAEIIVFHGSALNSTQRDQVEAYLNAKYRLYSTSDMPTISVGSEVGATNNGWTYLSYAPMSEYHLSTKMQDEPFGASSTEISGQIIDIFTKPFAMGNTAETWSNSSVDQTYKLSNYHCRTRLANTSAGIDSIVFHRMDPAGNVRSDLSKFNFSNPVEPTTYSSSDNDYIEADFWCENVSTLDLPNSYIQLRNQNLLSYSETYNNVVWNPSGGIVSFTIGQTDPFGGNRATLINFGASQFIFQRVSASYVLGKKWTFSGWVFGVPGSVLPIALNTRNAANSVLESAAINITLQSSFQRFTTTITLTSASATMDKVQVGFSTGLSATSGTFAFLQLEESGIATDYNARLTDASLNYKVNLSQNINSLISGSFCKLKFKKSTFTKTGTGDWSNVAALDVNIQTSSGTQNVWYGNFIETKNWTDDTTFRTSNPIRFRNCVSSDNDVSYFNEVTSEARIKSRPMTSGEIKISAWDYLTMVWDKTFSELDSFPVGFICFKSFLEPSFPGLGSYHTYFMKKILGFIFPNNYLDVDLEWLSYDLSLVSNFGNLQFFHILSSDKIGDVIQRLLNTTGGYIAYDQINNKLVVRNGYKYWTNAASTLPTPVVIPDALVYQYKDETGGNDMIYNYIEGKLVSDDVVSAVIYQNNDATFEFPPNSNTTIIIPRSDLAPGTLDAYPFSHFYINGYNFASDASSTSFSNNSISIVKVGTLGDSLVVVFNNANSSTRYLRQITIVGDYLRFLKSTIGQASVIGGGRSAVVYDYTPQSASSIAKYGKKEYPFNSYYGFAGYDIYGFLGYASLYDYLIYAFSEPANLWQIEIQYLPSVRIGEVVSVRSKDGRIITGHIIKLDIDSAGSEFTCTLTVREIK